MIRAFRDLRIAFTNIFKVSYGTGLSGFFLGNGGVISDGVTGIRIIGSGTTSNPFIYVDSSGVYGVPIPVIGHKYYVRLKAVVTNSVCQTIKVRFGDATATMVTSPTNGTVYDVSTVITAVGTTQNIYVYEYYADSTTANSKVLEVYKVEIFDLTADCGSGFEYTSALVDSTLSANAITYFTGTYSFNLNDFTTNGDKIIQPLKCVEIKQDNQDWRIEMDADLSYQPYLIQDYLLIVTTKSGDQPFRIRNISIDGEKVSLVARHVGYDLENYLCNMIFGYSYTSGTLAHLNNALELAIPTPPFTHNSDNVLNGKVVFKESTVLGIINEIIATLGGHIVMNWWDIRIDSTVGEDNQVTIEYGKNLQGAKIVEDWNSVCTTLIPVGNNNLLINGNKFIDLSTDILHATGVSYDRPYARKMVFQTDSTTELATLGTAYLENNKYPKLNYTVKANFDGSIASPGTILTLGGYEIVTLNDIHIQNKVANNYITLDIGDVIQVKARQFTILTNVLGYTFNVLTQKIIDVEFGNFRKDVRSVFSKIQASIEDLKKQVIQENIQMNAKIDALP